MQTKPKANSIITHEVTEFSGRPAIEFKFRGIPIGKLNLVDLSPQVRERATLHGMVQRIGDGGAVERMDKATGMIRTDAEMDDVKKARITALIEHYNSGTAEWNLTRSSTGGGASAASVLPCRCGGSVAWASASTFRGGDKRGGANGARLALAPSPASTAPSARYRSRCPSTRIWSSSTDVRFHRSCSISPATWCTARTPARASPLGRRSTS